MSTIAKEIESDLNTNPNIASKSLKDKIQQKHQIQVSEAKVRRAKTVARNKKNRDFTKQYSNLRSYIDELLKANLGSSIKLNVGPCSNPSIPTRQFKRIYILTAVDVDGNNCMCPDAFAIVEAECSQSWSWFLKNLGDDLNLPIGLIPAPEKVFPRAEHRFCCRRIHENMRQKWHGNLFKSLFYRAASTTYVPYFNIAMEEIKKLNLDLFLWLNEIPAKSWDKPIKACLEYIKEYMTKRIAKVGKCKQLSRALDTVCNQSLG
ncbi:uncharacterized protein LOC143541342 [Bidens hawaiensis]|uniref:uncharacterized protein LOC143541342 n=1 Tax=Bidens hawaiensis TaxID=980011 RepID=UPI0040498C6F